MLSPTNMGTPISYSSSQTDHYGDALCSQARLKDHMQMELFNAVFEHPKLLESVYPPPPHLAAAIAAFSKQERTNKRVFNDISEPLDFTPFYDLLNEAIDILPASERLHHRTLKFFGLKLLAPDDLNGAAEMNPCGVMANRENLDPLNWTTTEGAVEVNDSWAEMLAQAATYGRAMLEQSRWYSVVICFHHKEQTMRFCWYTRMGSFQTPALQYNDEDDLIQFVSGLVGLAACDRSDSGLDNFREYDTTGLFFALPLRLSEQDEPQWLWWKAVAKPIPGALGARIQH
jgi:hypothetical protein